MRDILRNLLKRNLSTEERKITIEFAEAETKMAAENFWTAPDVFYAAAYIELEKKLYFGKGNFN
jgi:hypothetical protein